MEAPMGKGGNWELKGQGKTEEGERDGNGNGNGSGKGKREDGERGEATVGTKIA